MHARQNVWQQGNVAGSRRTPSQISHVSSSLSLLTPACLDGRRSSYPSIAAASAIAAATEARRFVGGMPAARRVVCGSKSWHTRTIRRAAGRGPRASERQRAILRDDYVTREDYYFIAGCGSTPRGTTPGPCVLTPLCATASSVSSNPSERKKV